MKNFLTSHVAIIVAAIIVLLAPVFVLTGCKTAPQETTARLAVSYATAKYIEKAGTQSEQTARAVRVITVLDLVDKMAAGDSVTIDALRAYVAQRLPADLGPADRMLAGVLIDAAANELKARVGDGVIPADQLVKVKDVLKWIREGAIYYLPASVET